MEYSFSPDQFVTLPELTRDAKAGTWLNGTHRVPIEADQLEIHERVKINGSTWVVSSIVQWKGVAGEPLTGAYLETLGGFWSRNIWRGVDK